MRVSGGEGERREGREVTAGDDTKREDEMCNGKGEERKRWEKRREWEKGKGEGKGRREGEKGKEEEFR